MADLTHSHAVLYVDLLGFADMTMTSEDTPTHVPPYETGNWQDDYGAGAPQFWTEKSPISYRLLIFHRRLEELLHHAARSGKIRAMLFSDGAFIVRPDVQSLSHLAREIMRTCLLQMIPVRMGLATGTFQPLKFGADTIGEVGIYTSLFYGTGVVRAHFAERAGKGMRIFVHPSVAVQLPAGADSIVPVGFEHPNYRLLPLSGQSEHARWELDYLFRWKGKPWTAERQSDAATQDRALWEAAKAMKCLAPTDPEVQQQYSATLDALNRMRVAVGRPIFVDPNSST